MATYDLRTRQWLPLGLPAGGIFGQMSYRRLVEELRRSGEVKDDEEVTHLSFDLGFLRFRTEPRGAG